MAELERHGGVRTKERGSQQEKCCCSWAGWLGERHGGFTFHGEKACISLFETARSHGKLLYIGFSIFSRFSGSARRVALASAPEGPATWRLGHRVCPARGVLEGAWERSWRPYDAAPRRKLPKKAIFRDFRPVWGTRAALTFSYRVPTT